MKLEMPRAVIYTRVSTEEQVANYSLETQEETCRRYAKQKDLEIVRVFREEGASAKTINGRPVLLDLFKFCQDKKNKISTVLIYKFDRWSRDTREGLGAIGLMAKSGIDVVSATEPSQNNAMGKAMRNMMLVFAQLDNDVKSERTTSGMRAAFEAGRWAWQAPIGYKHTVVGDKKKLILLSKLKPLIKDLFTNASTGLYTKTELVDRLNKRGYKEFWGSPATEKTIDKILKKKFYFGVMEAKTWGIEKLGTHEQIIDEETWIKANEAMYRSRKPRVSENSSHFPLRGHVMCGSCLKPLTGSYSRGDGGRYAYYHCVNRGCSKATRKAKNDLDELYVDYLNQFTLSKIQRKLLCSTLIEKAEKKVLAHKKEVERLEGSLSQLQEDKRAVIRSNDKGHIDEEETRRLLDDLRTEEAVLKIEIGENQIDHTENVAVVSFINHFTGNVGRFWEKLDANKKRALQAKIFPENVCFKNGEFGTTKIARSFKLIRDFNEAKDPLVTPGGIEPPFSP